MDRLLSIAKTSVETFAREREIPEFEPTPEKLKEKRGVFVTLKKQGLLRGCIGQIDCESPLYKAVPLLAVAAAFQDPRFPPVSEEELPFLEYEVSVLGPLKPLKSVDELRLGVQGLMVKAQGRAALFLPQVALENGWDLETFLENLMFKAGLPPDYWKKNPAEFYTFEVEVIK